MGARGARTQPVDVLKLATSRACADAAAPVSRPAASGRFFRPTRRPPRYLVCNCDEAEPGTFKDHMLLEETPHLVLEGMLLGAYGIAAITRSSTFAASSSAATRSSWQALEEARAARYVGKNLFGTGYDLEVTVHRGAGAYICGEETGLLNSLEGKRGEPRLKPPFPAIEGLYGKPTVVNNVETLAYLVPILENGAGVVRRSRHRAQQRLQDRFGLRPRAKARATTKWRSGTTVREFIEIAGGLRPGRTFMAVQPGGGSSACIFEEHLDCPYDYEIMAKAGSMLGSGAFVVFDDTTDFVKAAYNLVRFFAHESCGQCTPCREGGSWLERVWSASSKRRGVAQRSRDDPARSVDTITGLNPCALGDSIEPFLARCIYRFPEQFEAASSAQGEAVEPHERPCSPEQELRQLLTIDGVPVTVPKGTLLVEAAKTVKQEIPVYCYHTKLGPAGLCRICLVEIEGMPKLQIACNTPVDRRHGRAHANGERVEPVARDGPRTLAGQSSARLSDLRQGRRVRSCKTMRWRTDAAAPTSPIRSCVSPRRVDLGPTIVLDEERCVVCQRCVRFDDIIADERQLVVKDRGAHDIIATATGEPYHHQLHRKRHRALPGRRAYVEDVSLQIASVGSQSHANDLHAVLGRLPAVRRRSPGHGAAHDVGRSTTIATPMAGCAIAAATTSVSTTRPSGSRSRSIEEDGNFVQIGWDDAIALWAKAITSDAQPAPATRRRDRRRSLDERRSLLLQQIFRAIGVRISTGAPDASARPTPGARGGDYAATRTRASHRGRRRIADGTCTGACGCARSQSALRGGAKICTSRKRRGARHCARCRSVMPARRDRVGRRRSRAGKSSCADASSGRDVVDVYRRASRATRAAPKRWACCRRRPGYVRRSGRDTSACSTRRATGSSRRFRSSASIRFGTRPMRASAEALMPCRSVVVSELFMTETAQRATLVLPAKGAFEKSGTTINVTGDLLPVNASLDAPVGPLSDFEMLVGLARQFDLALPTIEEVDAAVIARAAKCRSTGTFGDALYHSGATRAHAQELRPSRGRSGTGAGPPHMIRSTSRRLRLRSGRLEVEA